MRPIVYRIPKAGCSREEFEDAVAWSTRKRRFAVADGASASAFARLWAELLVRTYVAGRLRADEIEADLAPVQARWLEDVQGRPLPWYALEQVRRGAFAALVGLSIQPDHTWSSLAVGDSCLFHVRDGNLVTAFPLSDADEFDNRPMLIGSRPVANVGLTVHTTQGAWQPGDFFYLTSDALAAAFLRHGTLETRHLRGWVARMRAERLMRNDDVALLAYAAA